MEVERASPCPLVHTHSHARTQSMHSLLNSSRVRGGLKPTHHNCLIRPFVWTNLVTRSRTLTNPSHRRLGRFLSYLLRGRRGDLLRGARMAHGCWAACSISHRLHLVVCTWVPEPLADTEGGLPDNTVCIILQFKNDILCSHARPGPSRREAWVHL